MFIKLILKFKKEKGGFLRFESLLAHLKKKSTLKIFEVLKPGSSHHPILYSLLS